MPADQDAGARLDLGTLGFTAAALCAFASNSLLTRGALSASGTDPALFAAIRLGAGAAALGLLSSLRREPARGSRATGLVGPLALLAYILPFSFAYVRIGAAVGALVLFGAVQLTMIGYGLMRGERPSMLVWTGTALAAGGLVVLTLPAASRPDLLGFALMTLAGVAWGVYSVAGRQAADPLATNARNFGWSATATVLLLVIVGPVAAPSPRGLLLAVVAGAVTSGLGYAVWFRALRGLTVTQAAVAQLSVPVIAAVGAVAVLGEAVSPSLVTAGALVLTGVGLVLASRPGQT